LFAQAVAGLAPEQVEQVMAGLAPGEVMLRVAAALPAHRRGAAAVVVDALFDVARREIGEVPAAATVADLLPLVRATVAPAATAVTQEHVDGLVGAWGGGGRGG
jgi:hypothetical protein